MMHKHTFLMLSAGNQKRPKFWVSQLPPYRQSESGSVTTTVSNFVLTPAYKTTKAELEAASATVSVQNMQLILGKHEYSLNESATADIAISTMTMTVAYHSEQTTESAELAVSLGEMQLIDGVSRIMENAYATAAVQISNFKLEH